MCICSRVHDGCETTECGQLPPHTQQASDACFISNPAGCLKRRRQFGLLAQTKHEQELSALRSQLDVQEEKAASVSQELAAAKAAVSTAEQVRISVVTMSLLRSIRQHSSFAQVTVKQHRACLLISPAWTSVSRLV